MMRLYEVMASKPTPEAVRAKAAETAPLEQRVILLLKLYATYSSTELYTEALRRARAKSKVIIWPGADFMAIRKGDPDNPDLLFCDPGSVNLVTYDPATKRIGNEAMVYRVFFDAACRQLTKVQELGMRPTVQMFDPTYARATLLFLAQGLLNEPLMINFFWWPGNCHLDCR